jgi:OOP family OmpA-OmpF porin
MNDMFLNKLQAGIFFGLIMNSVAAIADNDFYIAPYGSYLHSDSQTKAHEGFGGGIAFGKEINTFFNVEARGFWQGYDNDYSCCNKADISLKGDSQLMGGTLDLQYFLSRDTFSPYIVTAIGAMNTRYKMQANILGETANYDKNATSFIFETGIGSTYKAIDYLSLRGDIRYRLNTFPSSVGSNNESIFNDMTVNLGIIVPFK